MTALLTDNLPLLTGSPNGIKKLRELILELAVRGKLVPQHLSDEPASELLKRIAEEKARLSAEGKSKKEKLFAEIDEEEKSFRLPEGWEWKRFGEIFSLEYGDNLPADKRSNTGEYPVYGSNGIVGTHNKCFVASPCIVVGRKGSAGALNLCIANGSCVTDVAYYCIPPSDCSLDYVFKLFHTLGLDTLGKGIKPGLNRNEVYELVVAIPPLPEQHRIVSKVDELMALCDRLEAQQADADRAHAQLVQALLDSLTQASDATDFTANWQRLAEHFHTLFTTEPSIDALKQILLELAVMGRLVPQERSDEPVTSLLKKNGIESQPHLLDGWAQVPLGQLGQIIGGSTPSKANAEFWEGDIPWVSPKDMKRQIIQDSEDHISSKALAETSLKAIPSQSLLMVVRGMILVHSFPVALTAREVTINQDMKALVPPKEISDYLLMYLQAVKKTMVGLVDRSSHGTCKLISEKLWSHIVFLPPLAEQHRIVAKVNKLMTLCDRLKLRLTQSRLLNNQLATVLVGQALKDRSEAFNTPVDKRNARILLAAEIVQQLHCEKRMGRVKLQKVISLAEHVARLKEIQSDEERYAAGPHDPVLMRQVEEGLRSRRWFDEVDMDGGKRHEYRPLAEAGAHREAYDALWSTEQRQQISQLIELVRSWDTARCERLSTLYSAWNDLLIEGRETTDAAILKEVLQGWHDNKKKSTEAVWMAELAEMKLHTLLVPTGFGKRTRGGIFSLI